MSQVKAIAPGNPLARIDVQQELLRCQSRLIFESSDSGVPTLSQGDVLVSRSGNTRLTLKSEASSGSDRQLLFLTRSRNNELGLEKALLSKVDRSRLLGVVKRATGNPLLRFSVLASNLAKNLDVLNNTATLLTCGALGGDLLKELINNAAPELVDVQVGLSVSSKRIQAVGARNIIPEIMYPLIVHYSASGLPADEYIEHVTFYGEPATELKERFMAACVLANTLGNARNLAGLQMALDDSRNQLH